MARRLGDSLFTQKLKLNEPGIKDFIENPSNFLVDIVRETGKDSQAALALIFSGGGQLESPIQWTTDRQSLLTQFDSTQGKVRETLSALDGVLVKLVEEAGSNHWRFRHPTIHDAFGAFIADDAELLSLFIKGAKIDHLLAEVTCGNINLPGAKLIVPRSAYPIIIDRLRSECLSKGKIGKITSFLTFRCDAEFLAAWISEVPDFPRQIPGLSSYIEFDIEAKLLAKLHRNQLLAEDVRQEALAEIRQLAVDTPDDGFLRLDGLLTDDEVTSIMDSVGADLLPCLSETIHNWESNFDPRSTDPGSYFGELKDTLNQFRTWFVRTDRMAEADEIASSLNEVDSAIGHLEERHSDFTRDSWNYNDSVRQPARDNGRNRFDDIDH